MKIFHIKPATALDQIVAVGQFVNEVKPNNFKDYEETPGDYIIRTFKEMMQEMAEIAIKQKPLLCSEEAIKKYTDSYCGDCSYFPMCKIIRRWL